MSTNIAIVAIRGIAIRNARAPTEVCGVEAQRKVSGPVSVQRHNVQWEPVEGGQLVRRDDNQWVASGQCLLHDPAPTADPFHVQPPFWFVNQQQPRLGCQSASYRDPLTFARGKSPYILVPQLLSTEPTRRLMSASVIATRTEMNVVPNGASEQIRRRMHEYDAASTRRKLRDNAAFDR